MGGNNTTPKDDDEEATFVLTPLVITAREIMDLVEEEDARNFLRVAQADHKDAAGLQRCLARGIDTLVRELRAAHDDAATLAQESQQLREANLALAAQLREIEEERDAAMRFVEGDEKLLIAQVENLTQQITAARQVMQLSSGGQGLAP